VEELPHRRRFALEVISELADDGRRVGDCGQRQVEDEVAPGVRDVLDRRQRPGIAALTRLDLLRPRAEDLIGMSRRSPLHRPLLYRRLLDEVLALVNSARRGYRPVAAVRSAVRGRVEPSSALRYSLTGDPRLRCHYDELTESTLLLGVICAGLEWIADGHAVRSPFGGRFAQPQLRHDAVTLRRALAEVTVVAPRTALTVGPRLYLNRLDRPWATALHLTLAVLTETEHAAHSRGPRAADAVELSIPTARLWETIVNRVLARSGFSQVLDQQSQPAGLVVDPWRSDPPTPTGTHPDNVAWRGADIWIVNAKYKTPPPDKPPSRDDQYQMFAYSHLVADQDSTVRRAVLVYPGQGPTRTWHRGRDDPDDPRRLLTVRIPFPNRTRCAPPRRGRPTWIRPLNSSAGRRLTPRPTGNPGWGRREIYGEPALGRGSRPGPTPRTDPAPAGCPPRRTGPAASSRRSIAETGTT
jgi:hypothetical protein